MSGQQWRIRVYGRPKRKPDIDLLVQAVLALAEQLAHERVEHGTEDNGLPPCTSQEQA
jgi:hypothetical protein